MSNYVFKKFKTREKKQSNSVYNRVNQDSWRIVSCRNNFEGL